MFLSQTFPSQRPHHEGNPMKLDLKLATGRVAAAVLAVSTTASVILHSPVAAAAHDELVSSNPAEGAVLSAIPTVVTLHFEEPPGTGPITLTVLGPNRQQVQKGVPHVAGSNISIVLRPAKLAGRYTIDYGIVSDDGHPVSGAISFTVNPTERSTPAAINSPEPTAVKHSSNSSIGLLVLGVLAALAIAVAASVSNQRRRLRIRS